MVDPAYRLRILFEENQNDKGFNLFGHLSELFTFILKENPENLYDKFELLSSFIQKNAFQYKESLPEG
jgi:hypothetical protein